MTNHAWHIMQELYPGISTTTDYRDLLNDEEIEIVAVATPVHTHFLDCIEGDEIPMTDGSKDVQVVKILEASQQSLQKSSKHISLV